jgi:DNA-binding winged helix-turn-helix (wHTH) protein
MNNEVVHLGASTMRVLVMLVEQREKPVSVDELLCAAWPNKIIEVSNVPAAVRILRTILGINAISTVNGHGYRFMLPTQALSSIH